MPACQFLLATNATRNGQVSRGFLLLPQTWSKASTMPEAGRMPFSGLSQQRGASPKVMQKPSLQHMHQTNLPWSSMALKSLTILGVSLSGSEEFGALFWRHTSDYGTMAANRGTTAERSVISSWPPVLAKIQVRKKPRLGPQESLIITATLQRTHTAVGQNDMSMKVSQNTKCNALKQWRYVKMKAQAATATFPTLCFVGPRLLWWRRPALQVWREKQVVANAGHKAVQVKWFKHTHTTYIICSYMLIYAYYLHIYIYILYVCVCVIIWYMQCILFFTCISVHMCL